jgi:predicted amidohydrolase
MCRSIHFCYTVHSLIIDLSCSLKCVPPSLFVLFQVLIYSSQWSLDLVGNKDRIIRSIIIAKQKGATLRVGPELEITGYGCLDHFLELDLYEQSWEVLHEIINHEECQDILLDIGMPVQHRSV